MTALLQGVYFPIESMQNLMGTGLFFIVFNMLV